MKLSVEEAYKKIDKKDIEKLEKQGYFLNAVLCVLKPESTHVHEFIFTFFHPEKNEIVQVVVDKNKVAIKKSAKAVKPSPEKLEIFNIKVHHDSAISTALKKFKKLNEPLSQIIISLGNNDWKVIFITKLLSVFIVYIDTQTGKIRKSHKEVLISQ